ncbi:MAG: 4Fe-4S binding protein [Thermodesulfobacteriota bacterium]
MAAQGVLLAGYLAVIWFSMGVVVPPGTKPKLFAQTQLATFLVWGIWLPLLIVFTVFFGRIWCAVCPLELVQKAGIRLGKNVFQKAFSLPKLLRTGITGVLIYSFLLYSVIAMRLPQIPGNLATLLSLLLVFSYLSGAFFGNRTFCNALCPASMLLRALGRRGMIRIREEVAPPSSASRDVERRIAPCPSRLNPRGLKDSSPCILCGQCVKSDPSLVPMVRRMPIVPDDDWHEYGWPVTVLAFFLSGFVIEHMFQVWPAGNVFFMAPPKAVTHALNLRAFSGAVDGMWCMFVVPGVIWLAICAAYRLFPGAGGFRDALKALSLPVMTILAGAHVILSMEKFSKWSVHFQAAIGSFMERLATHPLPQFSMIFMSAVGKGKQQGAASEPMLFSGSIMFAASLLMIVASMYSCMEMKKKRSGDAYRLVMIMALLFSIFIITPKLSALL